MSRVPHISATPPHISPQVRREQEELERVSALLKQVDLPLPATRSPTLTLTLTLP